MLKRVNVGSLRSNQTEKLTRTVNVNLHLEHMYSFPYSNIFETVRLTTVPVIRRKQPISSLRGNADLWSSGQIGRAEIKDVCFT